MTTLSLMRAAMLAATAAAMSAACVTINVYFPAAAAEKAADRIIDDVWGERASPAPSGETSSLRGALMRSTVGVLEWLVPAAEAAEPNLDIGSPEITRLKTQMERRFADLKPLLDKGLVGLGNDGFVAVRDPAAVPLAERNQVRSIVANENADRAALYREIAVANGQPQWETQIREVFAARWIAKAQSGWWVQDASGAWTQK
ncbi:YdbL family protein [Sinimarinibacterium thermocellulolyticum]|uniref:YdbL family protein n=1 Tax=Sinimarinibacterium thermocellulolyticum TaxID=3170016 RepID=A0ABV2A9I9_9GAMM